MKSLLIVMCMQSCGYHTPGYLIMCKRKNSPSHLPTWLIEGHEVCALHVTLVVQTDHVWSIRESHSQPSCPIPLQVDIQEVRVTVCINAYKDFAGGGITVGGSPCCDSVVCWCSVLQGTIWQCLRGLNTSWDYTQSE